MHIRIVQSAQQTGLWIMVPRFLTPSIMLDGPPEGHVTPVENGWFTAKPSATIAPANG